MMLLITLLFYFRLLQHLYARDHSKVPLPHQQSMYMFNDEKMEEAAAYTMPPRPGELSGKRLP